MKTPQLETKRTLLNDISEEDTGLIVKWRSNPEVYQYFLFPHPLKREEHVNWLNGSYQKNQNRIDFMVKLKSSKKKIGVFGVKRVCDKSDSVEISYILAPEEQGKGYASEVVLELMVFAKDTWSCKYAVAEIHKDNRKSIQLIKKLGFEYKEQNNFFCLFEKCLQDVNRKYK